ncbi:SDR family NAD(P)-dependent oxidoreductase [uncultured Alsobacter sp.]|uniref:SDR family NAD(P)-dependent oxidoreductase n=1 Tax=uncultured Alsobacter sp. TaxID=1748258 RepID=UPI0025FC0D34|nr:SDR family NAD(P)-dependent oxidoreductase [uncultured Alsobacter sp.]
MTAPAPRFAGKSVVVTGAAGVFGRWIAAAFAREGASVCLSDNRGDKLDAIARDIGLDPARTLTHATELTSEASIVDLAATVKKAWGAADFLVNNAGIYPHAGLLDLPVAEWDRIFDINLRAPFLVTRELAKLMIAEKRQGAIVTISSGAARQMRNGSVPYCTSKTAVERLTKGLALELAPYKIRVNVVEPGFAPGSDVSPLSDEYVEKMKQRIPLGRTSGPDDAPGAILYLCSDAASFITGTVLSVDGGNSIGTYEPGQLVGALDEAKRTG